MQAAKVNAKEANTRTAMFAVLTGTALRETVVHECSGIAIRRGMGAIPPTYWTFGI